MLLKSKQVIMWKSTCQGRVLWWPPAQLPSAGCLKQTSSEVWCCALLGSYSPGKHFFFRCHVIQFLNLKSTSAQDLKNNVSDSSGKIKLTASWKTYKASWISMRAAASNCTYSLKLSAHEMKNMTVIVF